MRFVVIALSFVITTSRVFAGLTWEQTTVELEAGPLDQKIEAVFRFTNTGQTSTTITQTHATCGCTVPTLEKKVFTAGESGELRVVYTIAEGSTGVQEKMITVVTQGSAEESFLLTLNVNIPGLWEVHPKFVKWEHGEERVARTVNIRALHPEIAKPIGVEAKDGRFVTELRASPDDPNMFVVTVTPQQTDAPMFTSITVKTDAPVESRRVVQLYAVVR